MHICIDRHMEAMENGSKCFPEVHEHLVSEDAGVKGYEEDDGNARSHDSESCHERTDIKFVEEMLTNLGSY